MRCICAGKCGGSWRKSASSAPEATTATACRTRPRGKSGFQASRAIGSRWRQRPRRAARPQLLRGAAAQRCYCFSAKYYGLDAKEEHGVRTAQTLRKRHSNSAGKGLDSHKNGLRQVRLAQQTIRQDKGLRRRQVNTPSSKGNSAGSWGARVRSRRRSCLLG